ncbi:MAG: branched-chain amino acid ABC transporter permease [Candidatus Promineofilum sp.]|nr:branched-chain amino acid ABC transporter permease [Promineifilum sp.]
MRRYGLHILAVVVFLLTVVPSWLGVYNGYIQFLLMLIGINIMLTASLNLINGYMGEFSVGHAAFMGLGAYVTSLLTVWLLTHDNVFGPPVLAPGFSLVIFPLALVAGGVAAAIFSLLVSIPSFRTRGDYLAVITLAVNFIFKSLIENIGAIGGPRGFMGMGEVLAVMNGVIRAPWLMIWTFFSCLATLFIIRNFVSSTYGKGIVAIREDEIAAEVMTVNTRRLKMVAFMLGCGLAGVAGGLHAHLLGFINPSSYFILQSTLVLVMVYLGGMGSLSGSIISAVGFTILLELLRPFGLLRWVATPLLLILLMLRRPTGIMGDRELHDVFPRLRKYFPSAEERLLEQ